MIRMNTGTDMVRKDKGNDHRRCMRRKINIFVPFFLGIMLFGGCSTLQTGKRTEGEKGTLESGDVHRGLLCSVNHWTFKGEKGNHIVISEMTNHDEVPPEVQIFPPHGGYESCAHDRYGRTLDHRLRESGEYTVIMHRDESSHPLAYDIELMKNSPGRVVMAQSGSREASRASWRLPSFIAGFYSVTPYLVAPLITAAYASVGMVGSLFTQEDQTENREETNEEIAYDVNDCGSSSETTALN